MITLPNGCRLTSDSIERALDHHQNAGLITRWHNWHEDKPGRRRPLYTVVLAGPRADTAQPDVIDLATLHEAHAFVAGLVSASDAGRY
jgi:hypothetical protein